MHLRAFKPVCRMLAVAIIAATPFAIFSQDAPKPKATGSYADSPSRWDIFAGYSYLAPKDTFDVQTPGGVLSTTPESLTSVNAGANESLSFYFNKYVGLTVDTGQHLWDTSSQNAFFTISSGPIFRYPTQDITIFAHGMVGGADVRGPIGQAYSWGPALTAGGGMDYETPWLNHHLAIRIFQADYQYMHVNWGPGAYQGRMNANAARLSAGLVFHAGSIAPPAPPTIACSASPTSVFPGDPITVTATAEGLNPKENTVYTWSGDGVTGTGTTAKVDTGSLAPGSYTVKCGVKEGKPGKEGLKPWQNADSSTIFTVKEFEPPTISCAANPTTLKPGESSTITATAMSPQNRPLTYTYTATAGTVTGNGNTATYSSAGAPTGSADVTCNVADDKGHSATANATLTIEAPPPPPAPSPEQVRLEARLALHSVFFPTAMPRPTHPEGGLVESQQATLTNLATDFKEYLQMKPDAHLILTGHADVRGSVEFNQALTERRVDRVKSFLVEQGISADAIETRAMGKEQQLSTDQVKDLVQENPDLTDVEKAKVLKKLNVIVLAQNRRVDITLSTTGQKSVRLYPFNAADSYTLLNEKAPAPKKKAKAKK
jgi:OmpA family